MSNIQERWKDLTDSINQIPLLPEKSIKWHLPNVFERELSFIGEALALILQRTEFNITPNYFTPVADLAKEEKEFLNRNHKAVLWLLQSDALYRQVFLKDYRLLLEFDFEYMRRLRMLCNLSSSDPAEKRVVKALCNVTRRWYIAFLSDNRRTVIYEDKDSLVIQIERA